MIIFPSETTEETNGNVMYHPLLIFIICIFHVTDADMHIQMRVHKHVVTKFLILSASRNGDRTVISRFPLKLITELNMLHDAKGLPRYVVWHAFAK